MQYKILILEFQTKDFLFLLFAERLLTPLYRCLFRLKIKLLNQNCYVLIDTDDLTDYTIQISTNKHQIRESLRNNICK